MLVGVISDTHDNMPKIAQACELFRARRVDAILHAGDFVAPFALKLLLKQGVPLTAVFGNNDGEREGLAALCEDLHESPHRFGLGGRVIVLSHEPEHLTDRIVDGADVLIHGHNHHAEAARRDGRLLVNPGEAGGWLTGHCSVAILRLETLEAEIIDLGRQETVKV